MKVTGVDFTRVPIQDFDRARQFYEETLGLEFGKRWGNMPAAEYETGSLTIALMQPDAFGLEFKPHSLPIALHVDESRPPARSSRPRASSSRATSSTPASATWRTSPTPTATS